VRQAVGDGLLLKGGGHAMAAGVTLHKDRLAQFRAFLEDRLRDAVTAARREDVLSIDGAVSAAGVTVDLCNLLARGGPYGSGNPEPILALPNHTIAFADPVGENHIRVRFRSLEGAFVNAISFRTADKPLGRALIENRGRAVHAAGCLAIDRYQGAERVQFRIIDIAAA
jgi:single-stranded-DNA-specific exonuclease